VERNIAMPLAGSALFFDHVAEKYASWYSDRSPGGFALRARRQKVLDLLGNAQGRILDVGCGPGVMTQDLMDLGWEFWGVDASPKMIRESHRSFGETGRAHFTVGDASHLPYVSESFDAVISMGVLDRLPSPEAAVNEMIRVLRKKGTLILAFANLLSPYAAWKAFVYYPILARLRPIYYRLTKRTQPPSLPSSLPRLYTPGSARRLLAKHGAEVSRTVFYNSNLFLSPLDELFPRWALRVTEGLEGSGRRALHRLGAGFLLKAHKRS
jgi:ubiquinone/menaquinone biosynthesis C-methylase UbiE